MSERKQERRYRIEVILPNVHLAAMSAGPLRRRIAGRRPIPLKLIKTLLARDFPAALVSQIAARL